MAIRPRVRFLASDIWEMPDDRNIYEVIDGELYMTPPPAWDHQNAVSNLHLIVGDHVRRNRLGKFVTAPTGVVLDEYSGVEPDLVYIARDRLHITGGRGVEGAPDLVVEVLSPSTRSRDRSVKMRRYAAAGIPHYWILDTPRQTLEVYELGAEGYVKTGEYGPGAVFRPSLFPGLEIPIDEIWS